MKIVESIQDFIRQAYVIAINQEERWQCERVFSACFGAVPTFVMGITDTALPLKRRIVLAHAQIIRMAKGLNLPYVTIFEADAYPCDNCSRTLRDILNDIPSDAKIVMLGYSYSRHYHADTGRWINVRMRTCGSGSYIVMKDAYDTVLSWCRENWCHYDYVLSYVHPTYCLQHPVFIQYNQSRSSHGGIGYIFRGNHAYPSIEGFSAYDEMRWKQLYESSYCSTVCVVHYNTPRLLEAALKSVAKNCSNITRCVIFENSDISVFKPDEEEYPFAIEILDNSRGEILDYNRVLSRHVNTGRNLGSFKHAAAVQYLIDTLSEPFILIDSDVCLCGDVDTLVDTDVLASGEICNGACHKVPVERIDPCCCFLNVPKIKEYGVRFFDEERIVGLGGDIPYDTGASFLCDLDARDLPVLVHDIHSICRHLGGGSLKDVDQDKWLEDCKPLYDSAPSPELNPVDEPRVAFAVLPAFGAEKYRRIQTHLINKLKRYYPRVPVVVINPYENSLLNGCTGDFVKAVLSKLAVPFDPKFKQYDKVCVLDTDIDIVGAIPHLFHTPTSDDGLAMAKDHWSDAWMRRELWPEHKAHNSCYFNSGVILMDLRKIRRRQNALVEIQQKIAIGASLSRINEQQVFNACYTINRLPDYWNWWYKWTPHPDIGFVHYYAGGVDVLHDAICNGSEGVYVER